MTNCTNNYVAGLKLRRAAAFRTPPLDCGHVDPWTCRHESGAVSEVQVDAYIATADLLLSVGLCPAPNAPAMRVMWQRKGDAQRIAQKIAEYWQVIA